MTAFGTMTFTERPGDVSAPRAVADTPGGADVSERTKICVRCGEPFVRNPKFSRSQWENTSHCSRLCGTRDQERPDRRNVCPDCGLLRLLVRGRCKSCHSAWMLQNDLEFRERRRSYARRWRAANPNYYNERAKRERQKVNARTLVGQAVRSGRLIPGPCGTCGVVPTEAHHDDYSQPLIVRWLCTTHHAEHHRRQRQDPRS